LKQVAAPVIANSEVMPGVYLIWLEAPHIASEAQPGQFVMVGCGEDNLLRRPLSIHQIADKTKLALLFTVVGKGTHWLAQRQVGDNLDLLGPLGNGFNLPETAREILLVAGGIGFAPISFLLDKTIKQGVRPTLLMGAKSSSQLYSKHMKTPRRDLSETPSKTHDYPLTYETITVTDDGSEGEEGLVIDLLPKFVEKADYIYACGPTAMYKTMAQMPELRNKSVQVSLEVRMGCGLGICYACTIKTKHGLKQVCQDGPIFDLDDVLWDELALDWEKKV